MSLEELGIGRPACRKTGWRWRRASDAAPAGALTSFHVNSVDNTISVKQPLNLPWGGTILKIPTENLCVYVDSVKQQTLQRSGNRGPNAPDDHSRTPCWGQAEEAASTGENTRKDPLFEITRADNMQNCCALSQDDHLFTAAPLVSSSRLTANYQWLAACLVPSPKTSYSTRCAAHLWLSHSLPNLLAHKQTWSVWLQWSWLFAKCLAEQTFQARQER